MRTSLIAVGLGFCSFIAGAQPAPAPAPGGGAAAAPAPRERHVMTVPPGFEKVTVGAHTAVCQPADAEWVKKALADVKPTTRPTTMPADLIARARAERAAVAKDMTADLGIAEKDAAAFVDEKLLPTLTKLDKLSVPLFYLVVTREKLNEVVGAGWGAPRYHFNRISNQATFDANIMMSIDQPMDDTVLPVFYKTTDAPDARAAELSKAVQGQVADLTSKVSNQGHLVVYTAVAQFVGTTVFDPLKLPRDQMWLAQGVTGYFAAKYTARLTGIPRDNFLVFVARDVGGPVSGRAIDLTKPLAESAMKPAAVQYYNDALRRKAVRAVVAWSMDAKGGEASISKVVAAVRAKAPADGAALVKLVQETGGVDLTKFLVAQ